MLEIQDRIGDCFIYNGEKKRVPSSESLSFPFSGVIVYEVIRYINGKGLFKQDHLERLARSAEQEKIRLPLCAADFDRDAAVLLAENGAENCNIKLLACEKEYVLYLSKTFYPAPEVYKKGVTTASLRIERPDPNAKVRRDSYVEAVTTFRESNRLFEALLVNREGLFTEGSRSNLFFVRKGENTVYTAPSEMILEGVMRKYLLSLCVDAGIPVIQKPVALGELDQVEAAFLTGTSIKVLPIAEIDGKAYNSSENPVVRELIRRFDAYVGQDI